MGLETTQTISGLDSAWPLANDAKSEGDNHIRTIKAVLKNVFPGSGGTGFDKPISATEDELNFVHGVTGAIQDQLNSKAPLISPVFQGTPTVPSLPANTFTEQAINGAFYANQANNAAPIYDTGTDTGNPGVSAYWARGDHTHPTRYKPATKSQMEAFDGNAMMTAGNAVLLALVPKAIVSANSAGTLLYSIRVSSVSPIATGKVTVTFNGFSMNGEYMVFATALDASSGVCRNVTIQSQSPTSFIAQCVNDAGALVNPDKWFFAVYGTQL